MDNELDQFLAELRAIEMWCPSEVGDMFTCEAPGYGYEASRTIETIVAIDPDSGFNVLCLPEFAKFMCGAWTDLHYFSLEGLRQNAEKGFIQQVTGPAVMLALYYEYGHESEEQTEARRNRICG